MINNHRKRNLPVGYWIFLVGYKRSANGSGINEGSYFLASEIHEAHGGSPRRFALPASQGHKAAPKEVGRTVSVSRRGKQLFRVFSVFRGETVEVIGNTF